MSDIQDPCEVQTPGGGTTPSSNNPRQGFIEGVRETAAENPEAIITVEPPGLGLTPNPIDLTPPEFEPGPPRPRVESEENFTKSRFIFPNGGSHLNTRVRFLAQEFAPYAYNAPIMGEYFLKQSQSLLARQALAFGLVRPGSQTLGPRPYTYQKSWLNPSTKLPLYSPGFDLHKFDSFRYVTGKHFSYLDETENGLSAVLTSIPSRNGVTFLNRGTSILPNQSLGSAEIRPATPQESENKFKSLSDIEELTELLDNEDFKDAEDSIIKFEPKFEKYAIECENVERPASVELLPASLDAAGNLYSISHPEYQTYMKSGWSWRNYFYGFYPLVSQRYSDMKHFRNFLTEPLVDNSLYHPNDKLLRMNESMVSITGQRDLYRQSGAGFGAINDKSSMAADLMSRKRAGESMVDFNESYSENLFPVIPFWGNRYLPDEVEVESAATHLHIPDLELPPPAAQFLAQGYTEEITKQGVNAWTASPQMSPGQLQFSPHTSYYTRPPRVGKDAIFVDLATKMQTFASRVELETNDQAISAYCDAKGHYNYYDEFYENNILANIETVEDIRSLPDPYSFNFEDYEANGGQLSFRRTVENGIGPSSIIWSRYANYANLSDRSIKDYNIPPEPLPPVQVFGSSRLTSQDFKQRYLLKNTSPMVIDFELKQKSKSLLVDLFNAYGKIDFSTPLLKTLGEFGQESNPVRNKSAIILNTRDQFTLRSEQRDEEGNITSEEELIRSTEVQDQSPVTPKQVKTVKLDTWLKDVKDSLQNPNNFSSYLERINSSFGFLLTKAKLEDFIEKHSRSYADIMRGKLAHSEVLGYKVDKYRIIAGASAAEGNRELVQTEYFSSTNEDDLIKYFDSQVEYGKIYQLDISTVLMTVGNKYAYIDGMTRRAVRSFNRDGRVKVSVANPPTEEFALLDIIRRWDNWHSEGMGGPEGPIHLSPKLYFGVVNKPEVTISEIFDKTLTVAILDKPPIPPDVDVIPYKGVKNKVLLNVNSMTGEMFAKPVILKDSDALDYALLAANQGLQPAIVLGPSDDDSPMEASLIHFKNDDLTLEFEVYRLDTEPTSLSDFKDKEIQTIDNGAPSGAFIDTISPNKKYWYTFRSKDIHGHVSMPSNVYQVELVSDGEVMYLLSDVHKIKEKEEKIFIKSFQRYLHLRPALLQTELDFSNAGDLSYSRWRTAGRRLGVSTNPLWGKKFVIKVKSKTTGKMVELKLKFTRKDGIVDADGKIDYDDFANGAAASTRGANTNGGFDFDA